MFVPMSFFGNRIDGVFRSRFLGEKWSNNSISRERCFLYKLVKPNTSGSHKSSVIKMIYIYLVVRISTCILAEYEGSIVTANQGTIMMAFLELG